MNVRNKLKITEKMSEINDSELQTRNSELPEGWRWLRLGELIWR